MKCPKCDYLGFETGDRCKNCGYDFSLLAAPEPEPADLSLKSATCATMCRSASCGWLIPIRRLSRPSRRTRSRRSNRFRCFRRPVQATSR